MTRKTFLTSLLAIPTAFALKLRAATPKIQVYKSPNCDCCLNWVKHLKDNGFEVTVQEVDDAPAYRRKAGVPSKIVGCHTAVMGDFAIEGHVPASEIKRFLKERPANAKGLAVPGMPVGSPGMEGGTPQAYSVILFDANGGTKVYKSYPGV